MIKQIKVLPVESRTSSTTTKATSSSTTPIANNSIVLSLLKKYNFSKQKKFKIYILIISLLTFIFILSLILALIFSFTTPDNFIQADQLNHTNLTNKCLPIKFKSFNLNDENRLYKQSFKCHQIHAYIPKFLSLETSILYGYPIRQEIICSNANIELKCPYGQVIHLLSSYYGLQTQTLTQCISNSTAHLVCFNKNTFDKLEYICENKQSCSIAITNGFLGEPCPGSSKQFLVQYQCLDSSFKGNNCSIDKSLPRLCPIQNSTVIKQQKWCEPSTMSIVCPNNKLIRIICAFYGIEPSLECEQTFRSGSEPTYCYSIKSVDKIKRNCDAKKTCSLSGDPNFVIGANFENICSGYAKVLFVQWECVLDDFKTEVLAENYSQLKTCEIEKNYLNKTCELNLNNLNPYFISNSTNTLMDYPIYEQITCNNARLVLTCPSNLLISIRSTYYGIQSRTNTNSCILSKAVDLEALPDECYFTDSIDKVKLVCEQKNSCILNANPNFFGDPCPNYPKQFFIQYQCIHETEFRLFNHSSCDKYNSSEFICSNSLTNKTKENSWCFSDDKEDDILIECENDLKIEIECSFYGLYPNITNCNQSKTNNTHICYFNDSFELLKSICNGENSCKIDNFTELFSKSCIGFNNSLYIKWNCN